MKARYDPQPIEAKWQAHWAERTFCHASRAPRGPSFYCLSALQDPGPNGLTIGHLRSYIATDVLARFRRMQGYDVLHPVVWDMFGLPVQRAAEERGCGYSVIVEEYVARARRQLVQTGISFDAEQEMCTSDADYYRWTQWGFLHLYRYGLIYQGKGMAYRCGSCDQERTTAELRDGCCASCGSKVEVELYAQWFVSLAAAAPRLEKNLLSQSWPSHVVRTQRAWLRRCDGYRVTMLIPGHATLAVFIEQVEWLADITFIAIDVASPPAQELLTNQLLEKLRTELAQVQPYDLKRGYIVAARAKGSAINPLDGRSVPILITTDGRPPSGVGPRAGVARWKSDDAALAERYDLPIGDTKAVRAFQPEPAHYEHLLDKQVVLPAVCYLLRDWRISRQRHWGAPVPMVNCPQCGMVPWSDNCLPICVQEKPGEIASEQTCPQCGERAIPDSRRISPFACISWYFVRAVSPGFPTSPIAPDLTSRLPVNVYIGATHHATLHLLLARVWTHMLYDTGIIDVEEPFKCILPYGTIAGSDGRRMSRAYANVVWVDDVLIEAGADALRLAVLQLGSLGANVRWEPSALQRASRLLRAVWQVATIEVAPQQGMTLHAGQARQECRMACQAVTLALNKGRFHLALAALARLTHRLSAFQQRRSVPADEWNIVIDHLIQLMAPFAPHMCEELWERRGHKESICTTAWMECKEGPV